MLVFGGDPANNDVWILRFSESPSWVLMAPSGSRPSPRREHSAIYDPVRRRMVVFAGADPLARSDSWVLSLPGQPSWSPLFPEGPVPASRQSHTSTFDPEGDAMVMFGGAAGATWFQDSWDLITFSRPILGKVDQAPEALWAGECSPSPFGAVTLLAFELARPEPVAMRIYDVAGRQIRSFALGSLGPGSHVASWDGTDDRGIAASPGRYFAVLESTNGKATRRVVLVR
jgi:hypothetical protein